MSNELYPSTENDHRRAAEAALEEAPRRETSNYFWNKVIACETDFIAPSPLLLFTGLHQEGEEWRIKIGILLRWCLCPITGGLFSCSRGTPSMDGGWWIVRGKRATMGNLISLLVSFCGNWNWPELNSIDYSLPPPWKWTAESVRWDERRKKSAVARMDTIIFLHVDDACSR